jgi:hypothetical protein
MHLDPERRSRSRRRRDCGHRLGDAEVRLDEERGGDLMRDGRWPV